ncbi:PREDICTED: bidirectional sugar transporter SWEET16-like isoform X1 [Ipomoea nil]|uniref:bidirectional sugar transporter SWEET16-like isoform X1 n=1 Tax=Ipomoea nil TaxID=35883 RepID=UPI0009014D66|nr:PREDICTED: bidirectional sugar transporter SWEET16-like isoform X1 [Ipomoea nil]
MASLSFIVGIIGNVISILMFLAPVKTFKRIVQKKSTENFKGIPYITTLLSTSLWSFYGLLKPGGLLVVTVNGTGVVLHIIYVSLFLIYAPKNIKIRSLKMVGIINVAFLGAVVAVTLSVLHGKTKLMSVGLLCTGLTIGMYASPLSAMRTVIKMKSVEYMPFWLSFFQVLNGGIWASYAMLVRDLYIGIPNGIGFLLGSAQIILYFIYYQSTPAKEEEDPAHLVKGGIEMANDVAFKSNGKDPSEARAHT